MIDDALRAGGCRYRDIRVTLDAVTADSVLIARAEDRTPVTDEE